MHRTEMSGEGKDFLVVVNGQIETVEVLFEI